MTDYFIKRAFSIDDMPEDIDLNAPPATGLDYLYRVRLEARNCPKVVVANIDTTKFLDRQTVQVDIYSGFIAAREGFGPEPEWQEMILEEFRETKEKIITNRDMLKEKFPHRHVPKINRAEDWCIYCLGAENQKKIYDDTPPESSDNDKLLPKSKRSRLSSECQPPLLSVLIHMDQNRIKKLLSHFDVWLGDVLFSDQVGKWIYSLLVCLEKPLDPDTCALLRSLSRHCCKFRNNITMLDDKLLKPLNMIITIIANYFDQKDLSDNFQNIA